MSDNVTKSSRDGMYYADTGKDFDLFIEAIESKLKSVSYKKPVLVGKGGFILITLYSMNFQSFMKIKN